MVHPAQPSRLGLLVAVVGLAARPVAGGQDAPKGSLPLSRARKRGTKGKVHENCIVGAGPAGLQMAYFFQKASRDYLLLEKAEGPGAFFNRFPRRRILISINKRNTGRRGKDYNLRHDWHSLLSDDDSLRMGRFSTNFYPEADEFVEYLHAFVNRTTPNVKFGREVLRIRDIGQGLHKENIPQWKGAEYAKTYGTYDLEPQRYTNQSVGIIGAGNSAFEVVSTSMEEAASVRVYGERVLAWETHYTGHLRSLNVPPIDNDELLLYDSFFLPIPHADAKDMMEIKRIRRSSDGRQTLCLSKEKEFEEAMGEHGLGHCFDHIIFCTGFNFDESILKGLSRHLPMILGRNDRKYPAINFNFESKGFKNLYFIGSAAHSFDYRYSSGGFIHGFRYMIQNLFRHLEERHYGIRWPSETYTLMGQDLMDKIVYRMNTTSALYQMFGVLCDLVVIRSREGIGRVEYFQEILLGDVSEFVWNHRNKTSEAEKKGVDDWEFFTLSLEYGDYDEHEELSAEGTFHNLDPAKSNLSIFLHPVIRYWKQPFSGKPITLTDTYTQTHRKTIRYPPNHIAEHHVLESLLTDWSVPELHIRPLNAFLDRIRYESL